MRLFRGLPSRPLVAALAAAGLLASLLPRPSSAASSQPTRARSTPGQNPVERALTGGVVSLRAPASTMILLPRSRFVMGSTAPDIIEAVGECIRHGHRCKETDFVDELPQHRVTLSAYWLDRTEVTVADYQRCVEVHRCDPVRYSQGAKRFAKPNYPVSLVSWEEARTYCEFRGARLPTEAELERAARGTSGRRYPWGELYNSHVVNHGRLGWARTDDKDGFAELAPVGSFPAGRTPEGFLDLAGNVAEWASDIYAPGYPDEARTDPTGPAPGTVGTSRVVRGGGYVDGAPWLRGAARKEADPASRRPYLGFRCARRAASSQ